MVYLIVVFYAIKGYGGIDERKGTRFIKEYS